MLLPTRLGGRNFAVPAVCAVAAHKSEAPDCPRRSWGVPDRHERSHAFKEAVRFVEEEFL